MERSSYSRLSSSKRGLRTSSPAHELPRWRSPSPMTASIIPPPIVQSTYRSTASAPAQSVILEPPPSRTTDRQTELEADLQFLLDAQADGLIKGYYGGTLDDQVSTGSATPTATSVWNPTAPRAMRPVRQKPGLRRARRGIYNRMVALSGLKDDELQQIDEDARDKERTLKKIDQWERKRKGLEGAAGDVSTDEDAVRVQRLQQEADALQEEINHVDLQLAEMKSRHRKLSKQISAVQNAAEAKTASYTTSLRLLDEEIQRFLSDTTDQALEPQTTNGETSLWQLPPQRRTLDMARQYWNGQREAVIAQRQGVEHEKSALDEAAPIWKDVCAHVNSFEEQLRGEMAKLSDKSSNSDTAAWDEPSSQEDRTDGLKSILSQLNTLIDTLRSRLALAEERHWNLLIAAIGAELDAMTKGRTMLEQMMSETEQRFDKSDKQTVDTDAASDGGEEIHKLDESFETARRKGSVSNGVDHEDDPDPALLFSQRDESEPE